MGNDMGRKKIDFHESCFGDVCVCMPINGHFSSDFDGMFDTLHDCWIHTMFENCRKHGNDSRRGVISKNGLSTLRSP